MRILMKINKKNISLFAAAMTLILIPVQSHAMLRRAIPTLAQLNTVGKVFGTMAKWTTAGAIYNANVGEIAITPDGIFLRKVKTLPDATSELAPIVQTSVTSSLAGSAK
jgi:hypothetical protein